MTGRCLSGLEVSGQPPRPPAPAAPPVPVPGPLHGEGGKRGEGGRGSWLPRHPAVITRAGGESPGWRCGAVRGRGSGSASPGGTRGIPAPPRLLSDGRQATPILPSDGLGDHSPALAEAPGAHPGLSRPGTHRARCPLCTWGCRRLLWVLELPRVRPRPVLPEMLWVLGTW